MSPGALDTLDAVLPADPNASGGGGFRTLNGSANSPGWQNDVIAGPTPEARNTEMWRLLNRWRMKGLSETEIRALAEALAKKWEYDESEYSKLEKQLERVMSNEPGEDAPGGTAVQIVESQPEEQSHLLPMPSTVRQGLAHDYAEMMSGACGTDYNYWYSGFLALFAASVSTHIRVGAFTKRPVRKYDVMIGAKSTGKSQARDMTHDFFVGLRTGDMAIPDAAHYRSIRNANSDQGIVAAAIAAGEHPLVLMPDEFASLLKKCSIQNATLGQTLTELYEKEDTDAWTKDDKSKGAPALRAYLSIVGGTTPGDFAAYFDAMTALGGLYSRFWLVAASRPYQYRGVRPPNPQQLHALRLRTRDAIRRAHGGPGIVEISPAAQARLDAWARGRAAVLQTEVAVRITDHVTKTAALLALTREDNQRPGELMINEMEMEIGMALGDWQLDVRQMFQIDAAETRSARWAMQIRRAIWSRVKNLPGAAVRDRDIRRAVNEHRWGPGIYPSIVDQLARAGELEKVAESKPGSGGWAPVAWRVGPEGLAGIEA